jgi:putative Mg2+ transporter-C (MgtC) family protein
VDWESTGAALRTVAIAGGLAALLGLERELARKPAGLRTHILVGIASSLLMLLGEGVLEQFAREQGTSIVQSDPLRVIQAIVVGISFLGAGTIVHQDGERVEGLTTAASILLAATIGITVALDRVALATALTVLVATILWLLGWVESRLVSPSPGNETGRHRAREPKRERVIPGSQTAPPGSD